ncbi:histidinol-phosphate transaminase [Peptostreptococcaceae bacterium OttesenSCG-928-C18]|nr:histidinol-phosphate transaminase [Peptostreptococcaceae bacterium OttesenSCG-928-C18]
MKKYLKKCLHEFSNYETKPIKEKYVVNANESPFNIGEDEKLRKIILKEVSNFNFNKYPDPNANELREELSKFVKRKKKNIICGNGGDEIINLIIMAFVEPKDNIIVHSPSFEMYQISSTINYGNVIKVPDLENYVIDTNSIIEQANKNNAKLIFLCTPNNPTGYLMSREEINKVIDNTESIIVLDEAYVEFSKLEQEDYTNNDRIIIVRTLSKLFGLAGLRIGYGIGSTNIINCLNKVKPPYNVNGLTQAIATNVLKNKELIIERINYFETERERLIKTLRKYKYLKVYDSNTNFILIKIDSAYKAKILKKLGENSILAKVYENKKELENCVRVSVSKKEVNELIIKSFIVKE